MSERGDRFHPDLPRLQALAEMVTTYRADQMKFCDTWSEEEDDEDEASSTATDSDEDENYDQDEGDPNDAEDEEDDA